MNESQNDTKGESDAAKKPQIFSPSFSEIPFQEKEKSLDWQEQPEQQKFNFFFPTKV